MDDPYEVLGVSRDATAAEIRAAYIARIRLHHPDRHAQASAEIQRHASARMKQVTAAYAVVSDPVERARYERARRRRSGSPRSDGDARDRGRDDRVWTTTPDGETFDYRRRAASEFPRDPADTRTAWSARPASEGSFGGGRRSGGGPGSSSRHRTSSGRPSWFERPAAAMRGRWILVPVVFLVLFGPRLVPDAVDRFVPDLGTSSVPVAQIPAHPAATGGTEPEAADAIARDLLRRANDERMARGLPALAWHPVLEERALRWSFHMVRSGAFEHSSDAFRAHPAFQGTGENILAGYLDSADAHVGWMRSDGHRESILNADFDAVGIGVVCSADGRIWATQIFGVYASRRAPRPGVDTGPEPVTRQDAGISCHDVDPR